MNLANGLLGLGGFNGIGGTQPQLTGLLGQYYNPQDLKKAKLKAGLLNAGIALLSQKPELGQGIGTSLGAALRGGAEGAQQAQADYMQNAMMGYSMDRQAKDDAWQAKTRERQQHAWDSEDQANEARKAFYSALPEDQRQLAEAYPEQFGKLYAEAQLRKAFPEPSTASKPAALQEYEYAVGQGFKGTFQDWEASKKGGMALSVDPQTGQVTFQQGGNIKPMTEAQSKDTTYTVRAADALKVFDPLAHNLTSFGSSTLGNTPYVGNYLKSKEYQQAEQAGNEFLQAILRKDTGAAITEGEQALYGDTYLPRPGDSPEVQAQKAQSRARAIEAMRAGMTPQAILAQETALRNLEAQKKQTPSPLGNDPLGLR